MVGLWKQILRLVTSLLSGTIRAMLSGRAAGMRKAEKCVFVIVPQAIEYLRRVTLYRDRVRRFFKVRTYLLWKAIPTV